MRRTDCPFPQIVVLPGHNRSRPCRDLIHTQLAFRGAHHKDSSLLDWSTEGKLTVPGPCVVLYVALTHGLDWSQRAETQVLWMVLWNHLGIQEKKKKDYHPTWLHSTVSLRMLHMIMLSLHNITIWIHYRHRGHTEVTDRSIKSWSSASRWISGIIGE